jgi:hypothetical protein
MRQEQTGASADRAPAYTGANYAEHEESSAGGPAATRVVLGEGFFAYLEDGVLHLRGYDGENDLVLESGVKAIYAENHVSDYWSYLRR